VVFDVIWIVAYNCIGIFAYYAKDVPQISKTKMQSAGSSALYTRDGKLLLTLEDP
jgi:penicillin-binding protein 1A